MESGLPPAEDRAELDGQVLVKCFGITREGWLRLTPGVLIELSAYWFGGWEHEIRSSKWGPDGPAWIESSGRGS